MGYQIGTVHSCIYGCGFGVDGSPRPFLLVFEAAAVDLSESAAAAFQPARPRPGGFFCGGHYANEEEGQGREVSDRRIIVLENGRSFARGLPMVDGRFQLFMDGDDVLDVTVDWSDWLGSDTISTSTFATDGGATIDNSSNTTTTATATLSGEDGVSEITHKIVTAAGLTKVLKFLTRNNERLTNDYRI